MKPKLEEKLKTLKEIIGSYERVAIAYSGGVDSTLLLRVAKEVLGDQCRAITANGAMMPRSEYEESIKIAREMGEEPLALTMDVFSLPAFLENGPRRCYHCKRYIFTAIKAAAKELDAQVVFDGSNLDDIKDYRPGMAALAELFVLSPLKDAGLTKDEIRTLSAHYGLPTATKPAMACLATRIPTGRTITPQALNQIEMGEECLKELGLSQYRLRLVDDWARIECLPSEFETVIKAAKPLTEALKTLGIKGVTLDLEGYQVGKMNAHKGGR